jgi:hypothetical protein
MKRSFLIKIEKPLEYVFPVKSVLKLGYWRRLPIISITEINMAISILAFRQEFSEVAPGI